MNYVVIKIYFFVPVRNSRVNYEWSSFFNEIRSGRKMNCKLFSLTDSVPVKQMPYPLRSQQNIPIINAQYHDAFKMILTFLDAE